jgi:hypothetical protein
VEASQFYPTFGDSKHKPCKGEREMTEPKKPLSKQTVKCPNCESIDIVIFDDTQPKPEDSGICPSCKMDVEAVYRHAHYQEMAERVRKGKTPVPAPEKDDPFSFRM